MLIQIYIYIYKLISKYCDCNKNVPHLSVVRIKEDSAHDNQTISDGLPSLHLQLLSDIYEDMFLKPDNQNIYTMKKTQEVSAT